MALFFTQMTVLLLAVTMLMLMRLIGHQQRHHRAQSLTIIEMADAVKTVSDAVTAQADTMIEVVDAMTKDDDEPISSVAIEALRRQFKN